MSDPLGPMTEAEINAKADAMTRETMARIDAVNDQLAAVEPGVVGGILSLMLARWLAGHFGENDADTKRLRNQLLAQNIATTRKLIPIEEARILGNLKEASH